MNVEKFPRLGVIYWPDRVESYQIKSKDSKVPETKGKKIYVYIQNKEREREKEKNQQKYA